ncbi:hypothetical protein AB0900_31415 [Streptomyces cellulosae]
MTTTHPADRPYTDDDIRTEAAICLLGLSTTPDVADIRRWLPGAYVESHREDDGSGHTWGDLLNENGLGEVTSKVHALIEGAADVSVWAINLGADGLQPDGHTLQLGAKEAGDDDSEQPFVRMHFAFHPDATDAERDRFVMELSKVVMRNL